VLWLVVSGFQSGQPAKQQGSEARVPDAGSTPAAKPAWKWTVEERLAARFDPEALTARETEHQAEQERIFERFGDPLEEERKKMKGPPAVTVHLDGSKTPELFLPSELFTLLIARGFSQRGNWDIQKSRGPIEERAAALGFGRDLWVRLEKAVAPYLQLLRKTGPLKGDRAGYTKRDIRLCQLRAKALEAAKAEFGEERFLRLLYEAMAPNARPIYILDGPDYRKHAEELRFIEEGCR
jgi:hypothetical protein